MRNQRVLRIGLALALAVLFTLPAAAQSSSDQVSAGDRVRVTTGKPLPDSTGEERLAGRIVTSDGVSLTLLPEHLSRPIVVPRSAIVKLEKSRGRVPRWQAAVVGAALGAGLGAVFGMILDTAGSSCTGECIVGPVATITGVFVGAGTGAAIGALKPRREIWVTIRF